MPDIVGLLDALGLPYRVRGRNVGRDHVNICCPRCGDKRFHLGFHKADGWFKCLRCGTGGRWGKKAKRILAEAAGVSLTQIEALVKESSAFLCGQQDIEDFASDVPGLVIEEADEEAEEVLLDYLEKRKLDVKKIVRLGHSVPRFVRYRGRPCLLFEMPGLLALRGPEQPWKILKHKDALRAYPQPPYCGDVLFLVEGLFDAFRFRASEVVAMLTTKPSRDLLKFLAGRKIIFWPDRDVFERDFASVQSIVADLVALGSEVVVFDYCKFPREWGKDADEIYCKIGEEVFTELVVLLRAKIKSPLGH